MPPIIQQRLAGILPAAKIRILLSERLTTVVVDASIERLLGFTQADFLAGKLTLSELIHPDDGDIAEALFSSIAPISGAFNIRLRQANGRMRCLKGRYRKIQLAAGGVRNRTTP